MVRDFVRGFRQETPNFVSAVVELTILLTFTVGVQVIFIVRGESRALRWR